MRQTTILERLEALEAERSALLDEAKEEALQSIQESIEQLEQLGAYYRLTEEEAPELVRGRPRARTNGNGKLNGKASVPRAVRSGGKGKVTRRTGIRQKVLTAIEASGRKGMTRGDLIAQFRAKDDSYKQSISNALVALKKLKHVKATNGIYKSG